MNSTNSILLCKPKFIFSVSVRFFQTHLYGAYNKKEVRNVYYHTRKPFPQQPRDYNDFVYGKTISIRRPCHLLNTIIILQTNDSNSKLITVSLKNVQAGTATGAADVWGATNGSTAAYGATAGAYSSYAGGDYAGATPFGTGSYP